MSYMASRPPQLAVNELPLAATVRELEAQLRRERARSAGLEHGVRALTETVATLRKEALPGLGDGGALTRPQLRQLVTGVASEAERWRHLVRHEPDRRTYEELLLDDPVLRDRVGVWLICWMDDQDTGFHDHDVSSGAVAVVAGRLEDERLTIGAPSRSHTYAAGDSFDFSPSDIHRVSHAGGGPAVSIHAYSPPLRRMGGYAVEADGVLRRTPMSYTEELRPPQLAAA